MSLLSSIPACAGAITLAALLASSAVAGPLFPPTGPPEPTMKRLDEISPSRCISSLPFIIDTPGTYELCGNLSLDSGKAAITIVVSGVVLDLNGFSLTGLPGSEHGVEIVPDVGDVTIRNGLIEDWGIDGVNARFAESVRCVDLSVRRCGGNGVSMANGSLERCIISDCVGDGVRVDASSTAAGIRQECVNNKVSCSGNGGAGLSITDAVFDLDSCVFSGNMGPGVSVSYTGVVKAQDYNSSRSNNIEAVGNGGGGFDLATSGASKVSITLEGSSLSSNTGPGVNVTSSSSDTVSIQMRTCEMNENSTEGFSCTNARFDMDSCVMKGNLGTGALITYTGLEKAQDYNSSRSNNTNGAANGGDGFDIRCTGLASASVVVEGGDFSGNGGKGISVSSLGSGTASLRGRDITANRNGLAGLSCADAPFDLDRCAFNSNTGAGMQITYTGLEKAQDYNSSRSNNGSAGLNSGGGVDIVTGGGAKVTLAFDGGSYSSNTGPGISLTCGTQDLVSLRVSRCETLENTESGMRVENAAVSLESCALKSNGLHGLHLVGSSPVKDYLNSSRSNNSGACEFDGNGGDGVFVESQGVEPVSLVVTDSSCRSNTGNGLHGGGAVWLDLDRTSCVGNGLSGVRLSSTGSGLSKADAKRCVFSDNGDGGVVCPEVAGAASVVLSSCTIERCGPDGVRMEASFSASALDLLMDSCVVSDCPGDGVYFDARAAGVGDPAPSSCVIDDSSIDRCEGRGVEAYGRTFSSSSSSYRGNGGGGTLCGMSEHFLFDSCVVSGNTTSGVEVDCPVVEISDSSCVSNLGVGVSISSSSMRVSSSTISNNLGDGLYCESGGGLVSSCVVASNSGDGVRVDSSGLSLEDNVVSGHRNASGDASGISLNSPGNRCVGNLLSDNDRPASVRANGNPLYENSTVGNSNPIFEDAAAGVSGNTPVSSRIDTAANPFTNITH